LTSTLPYYSRFIFSYLKTCLKLKRWVRFRVGTTDADIFIQIFTNKEYDFPFGFKPKFIIDAGANVGYTSLWFKQKFPETSIIAIEPEQSNYALYLKNLEGFQDITCLQQGLWYKKALLSVEDKFGLGKCGFIVHEVTDREICNVSATTIENILTCSHFEYIDILKLDIEGSEKEVFSLGNINWIYKVNVIFIELHDHLKPGCEDAVLSAIPEGLFNQHVLGENVVFIRKILLD